MYLNQRIPDRAKTNRHQIDSHHRQRPDRLLAYFRRQLPSATEHINDHGVWLDEFTLNKKVGNARSVDVFITKPNKEVGVLLNQEQQVIVELLTVELLSPTDN